MGLSTGTAVAPARENELAEAAETREDKITRLREQYQSGTYSVNAAAIGAKLVESLLKR